MSGEGGGSGGPNRTLTAVSGVSVGHASDPAGRTGCTVVLGPFTAAVEVWGSAVGSRELTTLDPRHVTGRCDAILLTGGSAFGLAAADGVVAGLEARGRGFSTPAGPVPIVPAAVLYDLEPGGPRPGPELGGAALEACTTDPVAEGRVGAGTGATVGKLGGREGAAPGGIGSWSDGVEGPRVGALAAVNAFGDVRDAGGRIVAGARDREGAWIDTREAIRGSPAGEDLAWAAPGASTTLAVVATDAPLDRAALRGVARLAAHALVHRITPCGTPFDGDVVFAVTTGGPAARTTAGEALRIGLRAQECLGRAIERAVRSAS